MIRYFCDICGAEIPEFTHCHEIGCSEKSCPSERNSTFYLYPQVACKDCMTATESLWEELGRRDKRGGEHYEEHEQ